MECAKVTTIVMSFIEPARANNLNAFKYLYTLLLYMPYSKDELTDIEQLTPSSPLIQKKCSGIIDDNLELQNPPENLTV